MKIKSRRGTAGCGRRLGKDQQTRRCTSTGTRVTGAWKQISKQRQRVDVSYETALRHGTWMDEESFKKTCIKEKEKLYLSD